MKTTFFLLCVFSLKGVHLIKKNVCSYTYLKYQLLDLFSVVNHRMTTLLRVPVLELVDKIVLHCRSQFCNDWWED